MSSWADVTCPACGHGDSHFGWPTYWCEDCDEHHDDLYRREHRNQEHARTMNRADIIEEYHDAGVPFSAHYAREHAWRLKA